MLETSSNIRIVLVQENENDRLLFRRAFQKSGVSCEIIECSRAEEALEQLSADAQSFDVVAVDHNLPGISGMDLCRKLLDNKIPPPLVLLAEIGSEQLVAEALKAGVNDYIIKDHEQGYLDLLPISLTKIAIRYSGRLVEKRTEGRLSESEQTFKAIFDNAADGILLADVETKKFYMGNHVICQMLGYDSQELTALSAMDIHPEQDTPHVMEQFEKQARGEITLAIDIPVKKKDGSVFYADVNAFSITLDGKTYLMGIFRDVSEQKIAEEKWRSLAETAPGFILTVSSDGTIQSLNHPTGGLTIEQGIGTKVYEHVEPGQCDIMRKSIEKVFITGEPGSYEILGLGPDGPNSAWYETHLGPVIRDGRVDGVTMVAIDITERKKAENALKQSEEKFRLAMEATNDALWDWNLVTNKVYRNPRHATMLGYEPREMDASQDDWEKRIHPDDRQAVFQIRNENLAGKRDSFEIEYRLRTKSGDYVWVLGRGKIVAFNDDGSPARMVGTNIDITERKRTEEVKTENQALIRGIMDNSGSIVVVRNLRGQYLMVNREAEKVLGMKSEQIIGKTPFDIHSGDKANEILADDKKVIESRSLLEIEDQLEVNGEIRIFQGTRFPLINADGEVYAVCTVATDKTEHKQAEEALRQSEEKFRLAMETANEALWDWNIVTNQVYRSPHYAAMLGYEPDELCTSHDTWKKLIHPDDRQLIFKTLNEHLDGKTDSYEMEYRLTAKSGDYVWILDRGKVVAFNNDGSPARMIGTNIDITERKRMHERDKIILKTCIDGFWLVDTQGRILEVNDAYCRMSGYSRDELLTMSVQDVEAVEEPHDTLQHIQRIMDKGFHRFQSSHRRKDGTIMDLDISVNYLNIDGGRTFTFFRDITERKKIAEALRKSEATYRTLVEQLPAITYIAALDEASTTLYVSPQVEDLIGFTVEEYKSDPDIWRKQLHPNDRDRVLKTLLRSRAEKTPFVEEYRMIAKNGSVVWFRDEAVIVKNEKNGPLFLQGVMYDITRHRQADEEIRKFKTISDNAGHGVAIVDLQGNIAYVNDSFAQMHQYGVDELIGKNLSIFHNEEQVEHVNQLNEQLKQQGNYVAEEVWHKKRDNTVFPTLMSATLVRDEGEEPLFMAATAIDMTKHKKAEELLRYSEERYRSVVEDSPVLLCSFLPDGEIVFVNTAYCEYFGKTSKELIGSNFKYLIPEGDRQGVLDNIVSLTVDSPTMTNEHKVYTPDGRIRWQRWTNRALFDEHGRAVSFQAFGEDITEQRSMKKALAESEEKYRTLVECAGDPIFAIDQRGVFLFANKQAEKEFKDQPDGLVGKTLWELFPKEMADRKAANIRKVIETGQRINMVSLSEIQGRPCWYNVTIEPLRGDRGSVTAAMLITRNIDDMKRAEEQIQKLSSAIEQSIDGVAISGLDTRLLYVNDSYARMHGYTLEEIAGMKVADLYPNKSDDYIRAINQRNTQGSFAGEVEHIRKDGTIFPAYLSITLLKNNKEEAIGSIAICRDLTEYKHTQKMLEIKNAALESSINGIVIGSIEGNLTYVNNSFLKIWGYKDQNEVLGRNAAEFWKVNDKAEEIENALRSGEGWIGELTAVRKDGSLFDIQVCQTSIRGENGTTISLMASFVDITESKRREEELSKYRVQMARAEQLASLGTLSATVAHQLTQPLTVIRLSMDNAIDELEAISSSETVIRRLKESVTQVSNITSIIGNFRSFARKSSGKTVAEVNLKAVAVRIAMLLSESARSANIVLRVRDMGELPCPWMNETDLEQLFFALIENSIQASDGKKNRQLLISGALKDKHIELRFSDDCGGISPENIDKLFEPFFTTRPRGQGTGLGLCIVQDVVSRIGGHVRVESEFGKGTTFIINLPIETDKIT